MRSQVVDGEGVVSVGKRRSDNELLKASEHVEYEVSQLNDCIFRLATQGLREKDGLLWNTLLTAFTVYARNLYQFLYANKPYPTDIVADDYFDDTHFWVKNRPAATPLLAEISRRVNKLSAHLTYERISMTTNYWWKWIDIHHDLKISLEYFVAHVPSHRLDQRLQDFAQNWQWTSNLPPRP